MEGRDVAMVLASAVAGVVVYKCMEYLSCRAGSEGTNTMTSREEKESRDSEEQKEDQKSEDEESEEEDEDELTPTGNIKDNYTLASGKFKMVSDLVAMVLRSSKQSIGSLCQHEFANGERENCCPVWTRHSRSLQNCLSVLQVSSQVMALFRSSEDRLESGE